MEKLPSKFELVDEESKQAIPRKIKKGVERMRKQQRNDRNMGLLENILGNVL